MKNIWVPLSGQIAQQRKVETIANNIANANTSGFKKDQLVFKEHLTALNRGVDDIHIPRNEFSPDDFYHTQGAENAYVAIDGSFTNFEQGQLNPTDNPFDLAISGKGFFEILTPAGVRFSRNGVFNQNAEGELVNKQGHRVLAKLENIPTEGTADPTERILKIPGNEKISINHQGEIFTRNGILNKLSIVEFKDVHALKKEGNDLYIVEDENNLNRNVAESKIYQGFVESSNVNAIEEMSELIKAHRHFESIQKAINAYDSISNKAANEIGKF